MTVRMLVAAHAPAQVPADGLYLPVHVGHARSLIDLGLQPDDVGDNISSLNDSYCELTAVYWAWRNLDAAAVGLSHYRRYFRGSLPGPRGRRILGSREAADLMHRYDVVLVRPRNYWVETVESHYRHGHHGEDLDALREALRQVPGDLAAFERVMVRRRMSPFNMFLMRREHFDAYCAWLFPLLAIVGAEADARSAYQHRFHGFLGERLLNVWVETLPSSVRVGHHDWVHVDGEPVMRKGVDLLRRKFLGTGRR